MYLFRSLDQLIHNLIGLDQIFVGQIRRNSAGRRVISALRSRRHLIQQFVDIDIAEMDAEILSYQIVIREGIQRTVGHIGIQPGGQQNIGVADHLPRPERGQQRAERIPIYRE